MSASLCLYCTTTIPSRTTEHVSTKSSYYTSDSLPCWEILMFSVIVYIYRSNHGWCKKTIMWIVFFFLNDYVHNFIRVFVHDIKKKQKNRVVTLRYFSFCKFLRRFGWWNRSLTEICKTNQNGTKKTRNENRPSNVQTNFLVQQTNLFCLFCQCLVFFEVQMWTWLEVILNSPLVHTPLDFFFREACWEPLLQRNHIQLCFFPYN